MLVVSFLGPAGSFTEEAALEVFGSSARLLPKPSAAEVVASVEEGEAAYGVVPVENSLEGGVTEALDALAESHVEVLLEVQLRVRLCLVARAGTKLEDVKAVASHPHALAQARSFLKKLGAKPIYASSTSEAVRIALSEHGVAALASRRAAELHGASVLLEGVEDFGASYTRFFVVGARGAPRPSPPSEPVGWKTSLVLRLKHEPGSLYKALEPFALRRVNLTRIESRPVRGTAWEYLFHLDFEGSLEDPACREALAELERRALSVKVLGSYPVVRPQARATLI